MTREKVGDREWDIYRIINSINGKSYIGITLRGVHKRWATHIAGALRGDRGAFAAAIRKYGPNSFSVTVLYHAISTREAHAVERGLIAAYRTLMPNGYNLSLGGDGQPLLPETRLKISKANPSSMQAAINARRKTPTLD